MPESIRVVLSGGPGTGKTSIIQALDKRGYLCHHEVSRDIIKEELEKGSDILPWQNLHDFSEKVIQGRLKQFHSAKTGLNFYDRSIVDSLAYMHKDGLPVKREWVDYSNEFKYSKKVFITGPWRAIFENDHERRESWNQLLEIHNHILSSYTDLGYETIIVPQLKNEERVDFILENLND